jgi:hypothetical protein
MDNRLVTCEERSGRRPAVDVCDGHLTRLADFLTESDALMVPPVANDEEGADYFFTTTCMRTKRLSDAGDDLAYLYFYKDQPGASSRLEGFVTSDRKSQRFIDPMHDPSGIGSPVSGLIFQLHSTGLTRYAESDSNGRFVFDGLPEGSYDLSAFANGYPKTNQLLAGPRRLFMKEKSCARQVFVVPQAKSPPTH